MKGLLQVVRHEVEHYGPLRGQPEVKVEVKNPSTQRSNPVEQSKLEIHRVELSFRVAPVLVCNKAYWRALKASYQVKHFYHSLTSNKIVPQIFFMFKRPQREGIDLEFHTPSRTLKVTSD